MCPVCQSKLTQRSRRKHWLRCEKCRRVFWLDTKGRLAGFPAWNYLLGELVPLPKPAVTVWR